MSENSPSFSEPNSNPKKGFFDSIRERFKKRPVPYVKLEELVKDPEKFIDLKKLRTTGYAKKIDRQTVSFPMIRMQNAGNNILVPFTDWITEATDMYEIRTSAKDRKSLLVSVESDVYSIAVPIAPTEETLDPKISYEFTGQLENVRLENGKETLVLVVSRVQTQV